MSEMVERVAWAMWKRRGFKKAPSQQFMDDARAAITAMREPTEAMLKAGSTKQDYYCGFVWQAMIDEALK